MSPFAAASAVFTISSVIIGAVWYLGTKLSSIDTKVEIITTNHLEHIYDRLGTIEARLMEGK